MYSIYIHSKIYQLRLLNNVSAKDVETFGWFQCCYRIIGNKIRCQVAATLSWHLLVLCFIFLSWSWILPFTSLGTCSKYGMSFTPHSPESLSFLLFVCDAFGISHNLQVNHFVQIIVITDPQIRAIQHAFPWWAIMPCAQSMLFASHLSL